MALYESFLQDINNEPTDTNAPQTNINPIFSDDLWAIDYFLTDPAPQADPITILEPSDEGNLILPPELKILPITDTLLDDGNIPETLEDPIFFDVINDTIPTELIDSEIIADYDPALDCGICLWDNPEFIEGDIVYDLEDPIFFDVINDTVPTDIIDSEIIADYDPALDCGICLWDKPVLDDGNIPETLEDPIFFDVINDVDGTLELPEIAICIRPFIGDDVSSIADYIIQDSAGLPELAICEFTPVKPQFDPAFMLSA